MPVEDIPATLRTKDVFHHIDMGFLNRRLCLTALPPDIRAAFVKERASGDDHFSKLSNDHLLVTMLLDVCTHAQVPTLMEALRLEKPQVVLCSTERLRACPEIYDAPRVSHEVVLEVNFDKPVRIEYHTEHLCSSTGKMTLAAGYEETHTQSIVGILHNEVDSFRIEPIVIGAPWFDHPRNGEDADALMWAGDDFGEILPEDIDQFSKMKNVTPATASEWMDVMKSLPESRIKDCFAKLLSEPSKKDWGGEANDHFSSNVMLGGVRKTAAFLLKGPAEFREMTLDMCGKRADQIYRLTNSGADISIVQNAHLIGEAVRATLRSMTVYPGQPRKYCVIDGQATYRILKAYSLV